MNKLYHKPNIISLVKINTFGNMKITKGKKNKKIGFANLKVRKSKIVEVKIKQEKEVENESKNKLRYKK